MKKIFALLTSLVISCNIAYASSNNLINHGWWKTATLEDVRKEIKNGADVNAKDSDNWSPILLAMRHTNSLEIVKTLIEAGADVNVKGEGGVTPLSAAWLFLSQPFIDLLLTSGVNDVKNYCKLVYTNIFDVNTCIANSTLHLEKDKQLPSCANSTEAMLYLTSYLQNLQIVIQSSGMSFAMMSGIDAASKYNCSFHKVFNQ